MTRGDRIVVAAVAALALCSAPLAAFAGSGSDAVTVRSPDGITSLSTAEDRTLRVSGTHGTVVVEVRDGRARVVRSSCPDGLCKRAGWSSAGHPVICAPNGVVVESGGGALDAVSR